MFCLSAGAASVDPPAFSTSTLDAHRATELASWISDYGYMMQHCVLKMNALPSAIGQPLIISLEKAPQLRNLEIDSLPYGTPIDSLEGLSSLTNLTFRNSCVVTNKCLPSNLHPDW